MAQAVPSGQGVQTSSFGVLCCHHHQLVRRDPGGVAAVQLLGAWVVRRPTAGRGASGAYNSPGRASSRVALRGRNAAKWRPFPIPQWEKAGSEADSEVGREDGE